MEIIDVTTTSIIPRKILFGNPVRAIPRISPDGTKLAYVAPVNDVLNVWIGDIGQDNYVPITNDTERGVRSYDWAHDGKHLLYIQDKGGDENWHLYSVNLGTGETRDLTPYENVRAMPLPGDKRYPQRVLVSMNKENPEVFDVYSVDLHTGVTELVAKNPGNFVAWLADREMEIRGAVRANPDGGNDLLVRDKPDAEWRVVVTWNAEDAMNSSPEGFSADGTAVYMIDARGANTGRLVRMELATGEVEVIAEDDQYDVEDVVFDSDSYLPQLVSFNRERKEWQALDPALQQDLDAIGVLHHGDFFIASRDNNDERWVIWLDQDNGPSECYLYYRITRAATFLFHNRSDLAQYHLAEMEPFSFTARDGLTIHGYITFPVGMERNNLPMVLRVHGGPWTRDTWGYSAEAQWIANRGYICMSVNYRGSIGYGKAFINAANKEWGGKMHDDLIDAVQWAVTQGYADRHHVAIYGGSYGGYAALVGATFTPDFFCCAVDIVGPSNLLTFIESIPPYWRPMIKLMHHRVGNPETEMEFLKERSPLFKVKEIRIPMLIAQGANDPRVKQAESEQIVEAMEHNGIPYKYMLFPDEGHGFAKPANRMKFYAAAENFLAEHLGGKYEEEPTNGGN